jgi:hypothetical protein
MNNPVSTNAYKFNPVAKNAYKFNTAATHRDRKNDYKRKEKHTKKGWE